MQFASWRAGFTSAAVFMFVSNALPALADPSPREPLSGRSWEESRQAAPTARSERDASSTGPNVVRASWYGGGERLNSHTASGERFDPRARTAAHRTLPLGTRARVINLLNGRETLVTINDRGPASWTGRSLDLTRQAAIDLDMIRGGEAHVKMEIVR